eukprot:CAMPEP_0170077612 /NCGR_PEP_ID=MMETSP0019_2-20121128/14391_1 /TAXON_ID=98059 /ORGANISM="Dinobryon sp., Strain UTEXLB2267" /LENGTH=1040 /DNA_ID=CAMNT_0010290039 /DNA_START=81 /DNA_END=3203 /DNA_ORIENTATION=-
MASSFGSLDINKSISKVSQSVSQGVNTVNINIESVFSGQPRGLSLFISEIRACKTKDQERVRVDAELGNIRQKFSNAANLTSYQKKKYVWKMCYIHMLGYEVDFGHLEFISLMASTKFTEKSVGYMAISLMLKPGDELMTLVINSMRNDIVGQSHGGQALGLAAVSNIGGADLAEALASDVQRLIVPPTEVGSRQSQGSGPPGSYEVEVHNKSMLCKKAALCLLRLFRTNPDIVILEDWMLRLGRLLEDRDLGVITSAMSLLLGFASSSPALFEPLVPYVISILTRLVVNKTCSMEYLYYRLPCPWLQVKCLRFLQYYKIPEAAQFELLNDVLSKILVRTEHSNAATETTNNNRSNAEHSILFEAINLILTFGPDAPAFLKEHTSAILGRFIGLKDANTRYLGLDAMTRLAKIDGPATVQMHQHTVLDSLKDADISVRRKALGLLFVLADASNAQEIVGELVLNLHSAEAAIKEDMVVKIAILAEKFSLNDSTAQGVRWYVDTMVQVLLLAGDYVAEAVWFRVVQVVLSSGSGGDLSLHEYAAEKLLGTVQSKWAHETAVAVAGYLLGEVGVSICERPGMSGLDQLTALTQHMAAVSTKVQAILLTSSVKLLNLYPEQTAGPVAQLLARYATSSELELQQRACEYLVLAATHLPDSSTVTVRVSAAVLESVLNPMPVYALHHSQHVLQDLAAGSRAEQAVTDRSVWTIDQGEKDASRDAYRQTRVPEGTVASPPRPDPVPDRLPPVKAPAPMVDLLSLDDTPPPAPSHPNPNPSPSPARLFTRAGLQGKQGRAQGLVLLDSEHLQLRLSIFDVRAHRARMGLVLVPKLPGGISDLTLSCYSQSPDCLLIKSASLVPSGSVPLDEEEPEQDRGLEVLQVAAECLRPFGEGQGPLLDLTYRLATDGHTHRAALRLPISVCTFCEPLPCDQAAYMSRWRSIEGSGTEAQQVVGCPVDMAWLRGEMVAGLGLGLAEGLDGPASVTGCASFTTGTLGPSGAPVSVGVLMRLEADAAQGKCRVTVRAKNPVLAQAFKAFVVEALSS